MYIEGQTLDPKCVRARTRQARSLGPVGIVAKLRFCESRVIVPRDENDKTIVRDKTIEYHRISGPVAERLSTVFRNVSNTIKQ